MISKHLMAVIASGFLIALSSSRASAGCESVDGRVTSQLVAVFSSGDACPSPLGLCTEGRFTGDLEGTFQFIADTLTPYAALDPTSPPDVAATTGRITLHTDFCDGALVLQDTSAFSLSPDGFFAGIQTVDGYMSSGDCHGASGRIRIEGVFQAGCVDCKYRGEICLASDDEDSDSD